MVWPNQPPDVRFVAISLQTREDLLLNQEPRLRQAPKSDGTPAEGKRGESSRTGNSTFYPSTPRGRSKGPKSPKVKRKTGEQADSSVTVKGPVVNSGGAKSDVPGKAQLKKTPKPAPSKGASEGSQEKLVDMKLQCRNCGGEFRFTAGEQKYFRTKGFSSTPPVRCKPCNAAKKAGKGGETGSKESKKAEPDPPIKEPSGDRAPPLVAEEKDNTKQNTPQDSDDEPDFKDDSSEAPLPDSSQETASAGEAPPPKPSRPVGAPPKLPRPANAAPPGAEDALVVAPEGPPQKPPRPADPAPTLATGAPAVVGHAPKVPTTGWHRNLLENPGGGGEYVAPGGTARSFTSGFDNGIGDVPTEGLVYLNLGDVPAEFEIPLRDLFRDYERGSLGIIPMFRPTHVRAAWRIVERCVDAGTLDRDTRPNVQRSTHLFADSGRFEVEVDLRLARVMHSMWTGGFLRWVCGSGRVRGPTIWDMKCLRAVTSITIRPGFTKLANVYGDAMTVRSARELDMHCARVPRDMTVNEVAGSDTTPDTVLFLKLCWAYKVLAKGLNHSEATELFTRAT